MHCDFVALSVLLSPLDAIIIIIIINTGQTELADSAQGTALSQIKTIHIVIYITIDKKSMSNHKKFS